MSILEDEIHVDDLPYHWNDRKVEFVCAGCGKKVHSEIRDLDRYVDLFVEGAVYCSHGCYPKGQPRKFRTKLEIRGEWVLDSIGLHEDIDYLQQESIGGTPYTADILFPDKGLIIEWYGDYWHGNPQVFPVLDELQNKAHAKDSRRRVELSILGYETLAFWERDVYDRPEAVGRMIYEVLTHMYYP